MTTNFEVRRLLEARQPYPRNGNVGHSTKAYYYAAYLGDKCIFSHRLRREVTDFIGCYVSSERRDLANSYKITFTRPE